MTDISLHCSTQYAEDSSAFSVKSLIDEAVKLKQAVIAITDLNSTQSFLEVEEYAKGRIKIVYGLRLSYHYLDDIIVLLAKNKAGLKALNILLSLGKKKKLTEEIIAKYRDNLYIGCEFLNDRMHHVMFMNDKDEVKAFMNFFDYFEFYYLGGHSFAVTVHNRNLMAICEEYNKPIYQTYNVTYPNKKIGKMVYMLLRKIKPNFETVIGHFPYGYSGKNSFSNTYDQDPKEIAETIDDFDISPKKRMLPVITGDEEILINLVNEKLDHNNYDRERIFNELTQVLNRNHTNIYLFIHFLLNNVRVKAIASLSTIDLQPNYILYLLGITEKPKECLSYSLKEPNIIIKLKHKDYLDFTTLTSEFFIDNLVLGTQNNYCLDRQHAERKFNDYNRIIYKEVSDEEKEQIINHIIGFKVTHNSMSHNLIVIPKEYDIYNLSAVWDIRGQDLECAFTEERFLEKWFLKIEIKTVSNNEIDL